MKAAFVLVFVAASVVAQAQAPKSSLEKINLHLKKATLQAPVLQPGRGPYAPGSYSLKQDHMPCVVPDTKTIVAIPNVLPQLQFPAVAAIPNPALKAAIEKSKIVRSPDVK